MTAPLIPTTDRPYQLLPPLDEQQRHILRQSIQKNGVLEPVVFDEDGEILDGHHRVEIAEELGIEYPRRVIDDLDRPGKHMYALTVNVARRQLDQATRGSLIAQMRLRGMSIREIAKATRMPKSTVSDTVHQLSEAGQLEQPEKITGADGRERPSTRPERPPFPGPSDTTTTPVDPGATPAPAVESPTAPVAPREPDPPAVDDVHRRELDDELARDSERRAQVRNLTSVLTYLVPRAITPAELAERSYRPVLDEFSQEDLDLAAETMAAIAALKRGM